MTYEIRQLDGRVAGIPPAIGRTEGRVSLNFYSPSDSPFRLPLNLLTPIRYYTSTPILVGALVGALRSFHKVFDGMCLRQLGALGCPCPGVGAPSIFSIAPTSPKISRRIDSGRSGHALTTAARSGSERRESASTVPDFVPPGMGRFTEVFTPLGFVESDSIPAASTGLLVRVYAVFDFASGVAGSGTSWARPHTMSSSKR